MHPNLEKYLSSNYRNQQELDQIMEWLQTDAGQQALQEALADDNPTSTNLPPTENFRKQEVLKRIQPQVTNPASWLSSQRWVMAACLSALLLTALTWIVVTQRTIILQTVPGEVTVFTLPDGSQVTLNGNSRLTYNRLSEVWQGQRACTLAGEAFFNVETTPERKPFVVHLAEGKAIEVTGTRFNAMSYGEETEITLQEGSVRYLTADQPEAQSGVIALVPGDQVRENLRTKQLTRQSVNPEVVAQWQQGRWILDGQDVRELSERFQRVFGKQLILGNAELYDQQLEGKIPSMDLSVMVGSITTLLGCNTYEIKEREIILHCQ